jgi:histidinol-phosphate aminotransferase
MSDIPVRKVVVEIKDYVPGKTPQEPGVVKLASNENPFGPSPKALEAIAKEASRLQIYPDQKSLTLREALAKKYSLVPANIICGNGSDDIMQIIAATYLNPGEEVVIFEKSFSVYELITRLFAGQPRLVPLKDGQQDLNAAAKAVGQKTKIVFLTNPHNPTGTSLKKAELDEFIAKMPNRVLIVIDEAYAEFAEDVNFGDSLKYVRAGKSVIVLRTFSKYYGLAGLRVGYGISSPEIAAPMLKTKMPFNVSRLAQVGAVAALDDKAFTEETRRNNSEGKKYLYGQFDRLGVAYYKTEANFIFVDLKSSADEMFMSLMRAGVIIRPLTSFGFPQAIRVSIGMPEQNAKFIAAFETALRG